MMAEASISPANEAKPLPIGIPGAESGKHEADIKGFKSCLNDLIHKADELEKRVNEVTQFYANKKQVNISKANSVVKDKDKEKSVGNSNVSCRVNCRDSIAEVDGFQKEIVCSKRTQELMRQFGTIFRQISSHKWASPFMDPVDVKGLGLDDYYAVIKKPMDFHTIQKRMEAKDDSRYRTVREIYSDVRLVFTNAMTYNDERSDVHVMAKTLLDKFEEKWLQLLPKVIEEETRLKGEEAQALANVHITKEAGIERLARDTDNELSELSMHLDDLRKMVLQRCRKMSTDEKRKLSMGLSHLSADDLNKALEIIAQDNPSFQFTAEEVDLDMDAQSETTLWRLKFFVKGALEQQAKTDETSKRKRDICDALAKTAKKRNKKSSS